MKQAEYQTIADNIRQSVDAIIPGGEHSFYARHFAYDLAHRLADEFTVKDETFNREQFFKTCGF